MIGIVNDLYDVDMRMRFFPKPSRLIDRTGLRLSAARDLTLILAHFAVCVDPSTPAFMSQPPCIRPRATRLRWNMERAGSWRQSQQSFNTSWQDSLENTLLHRYIRTTATKASQR
jgi:hypothetical protein